MNQSSLLDALGIQIYNMIKNTRRTTNLHKNKQLEQLNEIKTTYKQLRERLLNQRSITPFKMDSYMPTQSYRSASQYTNINGVVDHKFAEEGRRGGQIMFQRATHNGRPVIMSKTLRHPTQLRRRRQLG